MWVTVPPTPTARAGNIRNGSRPKTVLTHAAGGVTIEVARDRAGTFAPSSSPSGTGASGAGTRSRSLCTPKGLTPGGISAHFAEG